MKQPAKRILLGIPAFDNLITCQLGFFMWNLAQVSKDPASPVRFEAEVLPGIQPCELARNMIIKTFLDSDCTHLWYIDADMIPNSETIRLIEAEADIVGSYMHKFNHANPEKGTGPATSPVVYRVMPGFTPQQHLDGETDPPETLEVCDPANDGGGVQSIDAIGTGSMLIKRRVLEDKRMRVGEDGPEGPAIFRNIYNDNGKKRMGLDIEFCLRARTLGYSVAVNWDSKIGHLKSVDLFQVERFALDCFARGVRWSKSNGSRPRSDESRGTGSPSPQEIGISEYGKNVAG